MARRVKTFNNFDPLYALRVLHKRRWWALSVLFVVLGLEAMDVASAPRIYQSTARLHLSRIPPKVVDFRQVVVERQIGGVYLETQLEILESRALARKTLDALDLWHTPPFGGPPVEPPFSLVRTVSRAPARALSWLRGLFRGSRAQQPRPPADLSETRAQAAAVNVLLAGLVARRVPDTRMVDVSFRSADPALAEMIVNGHVEAYVQQNLENKFMASREANAWLAERLEDQRKEVEQAELALQRYREAHGAVATETRSGFVTQELADLSAALTMAKMDRIAKEGAFTLLRQSQDDPEALDSFPAIAGNPSIQEQKAQLAAINGELLQLSQGLGERHPRIVALRKQIAERETNLRAEVLNIVEVAGHQYRAALQHENDLAGAVARQMGEAQVQNRAAIQAGALERDVESATRIYRALQRREKETAVSAELRASHIRVIDPGERPRYPVSPRIARTMTRAVLLGIGLAVAVAFLREALDNRIAHPNEIKAHLGIPVLGYLPLLRNGDVSDAPLLNRGAPELFTEAFRTVTTNVMFSSAEPGPKTVVVTSTGPGDGKTLVATNLAVSLAQTGQRVLLIDADMRRPKVHRTFGLEQEPGLSNLMVGNATVSEVLHDSDVEGLRVMTAGRIPPNAAELLDSARFRDFVAARREEFDWVVVDSPPVMAVTDAAILGHGASGVLFVVRAGVTNRHAAAAALSQLQRSSSPICGCVLNAVDLDGNGYYYSGIYKREYGAYYSRGAAT